MKALVSHQLVEYLEDRGVRHVFGLCGHTNIAVLAAMEKSAVHFVNVRHEQIAAHAADGYARVTRKASVLLTHLGPGLTNAATGVANAALDCVPMVVIAGDVPAHYFGKHPHQEVNLRLDGGQFEIYRPIVKRAWRADRPDLFPEILDKAFHLAESGRPGPVLIDVPMDVFSMETETARFDKVKQNADAYRKPALDDATAEEIVRALMAAKKPVLYIGGDVIQSGAAAALKPLVDRLGIPVAHSLMGKGALPDDHPLTLGMTGFWGTRFINDTCREADWILAIGVRFKEADSSSWYPEYTFNIPPTKLIHIDIDPEEIGRNYPVELGAVACPKQALGALNRAAERLISEPVENTEMKRAIQEYRRTFADRNQKMIASDAFPMMPERILAEARAVLPEDAVIAVDVGWNKNGVGQQFPIYTPGGILIPGGYATMGFGGPAALGAKIAHPEKPVVTLVGDGGFGQNPAVLSTARHENVAAVFVIMNNDAFGTIAGLEKAHFNTTYGTVFEKDGVSTSPNYAEIARAYGVTGIRIEKAAEFKPALEKAVAANEPVVIDVPMINNPVPTDGHWNILDIYSPGKKVSHVGT